MKHNSEPSLFMRHLGDDFSLLPDALQAGHRTGDGLVLAGRARVLRGDTIWAKCLAALFRFPPAAEDVPVTVEMTPKAGGELWLRRFDGRAFRSFLRRDGQRMTERFGPLTFTLDLHVADGRLHYPVIAGRAGPVPLPRWCLPVSIACEYEAADRFHFDVALRAPLTQKLMVHYQGWLAPVAGNKD